MARGRQPDAPASGQEAGDQVDFSWLTGGLRRLGVLRERSVSDVESSSSRTAGDRRARLLLLVAVAGYVGLFLRWSFRNYDGHGVEAFDLGIFDQGVWLLSRFQEPFVTINGRNLFGDHTSFILLPFAALYRVLPTAKLLLAAQTLALAAGAWPTFLIAREKLRSEMLAALLAVAYLLHPVVGWANLTDSFHPDAFEVPLVLFTVWFLLKRRWLGYWVCVAALLLVKEDVALLTFGLGVYVALRHDRRVGLLTCAVSAAYFVAAFALIIPGFLGAGTVYTRRVAFGGPTGLLEKAVTDPGEVFSYLLTRDRAWYLWQLFAPLAFVAWWAPGVLLVALGPLAANLLSNFPYQFDVRYHYSTLILPVLVVATIFAVAAAPRHKHGGAVGLVVIASLLCAYLWSPTPFGQARPLIADPGHPSVASFHRAERLVPPGAIVSAHHSYVPQLSHRKEIYMFPNPWKASYWGTFAQEGTRLQEADRVQYLLVPSPLGGEDGILLDSIRGELSLLYDEDGVQLFGRRP